MKKIIFVFLTLFMSILNPKALSKFYISDNIPNMHIKLEGDNQVPFIIKRDDGEIVYSIDKIKNIKENEYYNEYTYNYLTEEQLNKINLIAYYGYQYSNHTDIKWYGITQFLIWKTLYNDVYFTDHEGNKIPVYEEEINQVEQLIDNHFKLPNFANRTIENSVNRTFELSDYHKVFNNYEIKSSNIDANIVGDKVYVNTKGEGSYNITFVRRSPIERDYILYGLNDSGFIIYPGKINDIEFKVDINISKGSITINKKDSENINRNFASLEGAEYGIYYNKKLINTVKTNKDGVGFIDNITWGRVYTIKELNPSKGYRLDENNYEITLTKETKDFVINLEENVIKGNLIINKHYKEGNEYKLEDGATFEIYDVNDNLIGTYKSLNGVINVKLEYGKYYGIQTSGKSGYNLADKFDISIEEEKDYVIDLYSEKEILVVEVPNTKKFDYEIFISIIFIILGIIFILKSRKKDY